MAAGRQNRNRKIDQAIGALIRSYAASNEAGAPASSPHLHQRIRARIEAEKRRRLEEGSAWSTLFLEAKHVIPFLTVIAMIAMGLAIYSPAIDHSRSPNPLSHAPQVLVANDIAPFSNDAMMVSAVGNGDRKE